ncbi:MAG: hypothetical protein SFX73_00660 [Kofleriaceae bacterium]|nr:hypothetical protein [Kofleriaceae bacterium]
MKWDDGLLLVRRSHTHRNEVMDETKTGRDQVIALDQRQLEILRWHVAELERDNARRAKRHPAAAETMAASELLFPAMPTKWNHGGGFRSPSCLERAFQAVSAALGLAYEVTPRAMRRTYRSAREK